MDSLIQSFSHCRDHYWLCYHDHWMILKNKIGISYTVDSQKEWKCLVLEVDGLLNQLRYGSKPKLTFILQRPSTFRSSNRPFWKSYSQRSQTISIKISISAPYTTLRLMWRMWIRMLNTHSRSWFTWRQSLRWFHIWFRVIYVQFSLWGFQNFYFFFNDSTWWWRELFLNIFEPVASNSFQFFLN